MSSIVLKVAAHVLHQEDDHSEWRTRRVAPPVTEAMINRNRAKAAAARAKRIIELQNQKRLDMLAARLEKQEIPQANRYAILGDEYRLRQEIECGHDINLRNTGNGRTILLDAVSYGHFHIVRMLLNDYGQYTDIHIPTLLGKATALHLAVEGSYRQIASMLITFGADVNRQDDHGFTPLHMVKTLTLLKLLLKYPVDVCIRDNNGCTPLERYLKVTPEEEQVKELIELLGAREDVRNLELARIRAANKRNFRDEYIRKLELVTSAQSTVISYKEER